MSSSYNASYPGIGDMLRSEFMAEALRPFAERIKEAAEAAAPFDEKSKDGTHYKDSFHVETHQTGGGDRMDRARAKVYNDDPAAVFVEFGATRSNGKHTEGRHILLKSLDAAKDA